MYKIFSFVGNDYKYNMKHSGKTCDLLFLIVCTCYRHSQRSYSSRHAYVWRVLVEKHNVMLITTHVLT